MPANCPPVLLIESHGDVLEAIRTSLVEEGYRVAPARDVLEALQALEGLGRPGLVLLDGMLPEADQESLLRRLATTPGLEGVPVVQLAANDCAVGPGRRTVLRKPFSLDKLYTTVAAHCEKRGAPKLSIVSSVAPSTAEPRAATSGTPPNGYPRLWSTSR
jgi:two-component system, cell cycle response regulator DivK